MPFTPEEENKLDFLYSEWTHPHFISINVRNGLTLSGYVRKPGSLGMWTLSLQMLGGGTNSMLFACLLVGPFATLFSAGR